MFYLIESLVSEFVAGMVEIYNIGGPYPVMGGIFYLWIPKCEKEVITLIILTYRFSRCIHSVDKTVYLDLILS